MEKGNAEKKWGLYMNVYIYILYICIYKRKFF